MKTGNYISLRLRHLTRPYGVFTVSSQPICASPLRVIVPGFAICPVVGRRLLFCCRSYGAHGKRATTPTFAFMKHSRQLFNHNTSRPAAIASVLNNKPPRVTNQ
jgi:hypothetical protein